MHKSIKSYPTTKESSPSLKEIEDLETKGTMNRPTHEEAGRQARTDNSADLFSATVKIEETLNLLPEVTWDRWTGEIGGEYGVSVFGWIPRDDGKSDFVFVRIDDDGCWMYGTSSAKYSDEFGRRLKFYGSNGHDPCKRVEDAFPNVKAVKISKTREFNVAALKATQDRFPKWVKTDVDAFEATCPSDKDELVYMPKDRLEAFWNEALAWARKCEMELAIRQATEDGEQAG